MVGWRCVGGCCLIVRAKVTDTSSMTHTACNATREWRLGQSKHGDQVGVRQLSQMAPTMLASLPKIRSAQKLLLHEANSLGFRASHDLCL